MRNAMKKYFGRSRVFRIARAAKFVAVVQTLLLAGASQPAFAQIMGALPTVRNVALGPSPKFNSAVEPMALMTQGPLGDYSVILRSIERSTGQALGLDVAAALPAGVTPVDMMWSRIMLPGKLLVLDTNFFVREYTAGYDANGQITLTAPAGGTGVYGPYGDPAVDGAPTAMAEAPGFFLAIGTTNGTLSMDDGSGVLTKTVITRDPILDLAAVPQYGYFAFVILTHDSLTGDSRLAGLHPDGDSKTAGAQPTVFFNLLADPRPDPNLQTIAAATLEPDAVPLTELTEVSLIASNSQSVFRVTIPAVPVGSSTAAASILDFRPIVRIALGSLAMVPADGSGVLYDPGFNLNHGGISGTLRTIYGNSAQLAPATLNLSGRGQFITAVIEVAGGGTNSIEQRNIVLEVNGGFAKQSLDFAPQLGDDDKDGNADLKVKFDRATVQSLLAGVSGTVPVTLRWQFTDGSSGSASGQIRVFE